MGKKKSECLLSVSYGAFHNTLADFMVESFLKHNNEWDDWDVRQVRDSEIRVPVVCLENGITPYNACKIGRWVEIRELLNEYEYVVYCDNDILWYNSLKDMVLDGIQLAPRYLDYASRYEHRNEVFTRGLYDDGFIVASKENGMQACDFVIESVCRDPKHFVCDESANLADPSLVGTMQLGAVVDALQDIGVNFTKDLDKGIDVSHLNVGFLKRSVETDDAGVDYVDYRSCDETPLRFIHFSNPQELLERHGTLHVHAKEYMENLKACQMKERETLGDKVMRMRDENGGIQGLKDLIDTMFNEDQRNLVGAEIGSYAGESSEIFMSSGKFSKFYCIDAWQKGYDADDDASYTDMGKVEEAFDKRHGSDPRVVKVKGFSYDVADQIEDGSLDFLYIDGLHTYEGVTRDLKAYFRKVKPNGVIAGHDYAVVPWEGVVKAVDEFFKHRPTNVFCDTSWANRVKTGK